METTREAQTQSLETRVMTSEVRIRGTPLAMEGLRELEDRTLSDVKPGRRKKTESLTGPGNTKKPPRGGGGLPEYKEKRGRRKT